MKKYLLLSLVSVSLGLGAYGQAVTTNPSPVVDGTGNLIIHFHPYNDTGTNNYGGAQYKNVSALYMYTYLKTVTPASSNGYQVASWGNVSTTPALTATKVDSNDYVFTLQNIRATYGIGADTTIDTIAVIFRNAAGNTQTANIYIPVVEHPVVTSSPTPIVDGNENVTITFHPYNDIGAYNAAQYDNADSVFMYTYLHTTTPTDNDSHQIVPWGSVATTPSMKAVKIDSNDYTFTFTDLRASYAVGADTAINVMAVIFRNSGGTTQTGNIFIPVVGPLLTTNPAVVYDTDNNLKITYHPYNDPQNSQTGNNSVVFENYQDSMYVYTWLQSTRPSSGGNAHQAVAWGSVGSTPGLYVAKIDSNDFNWTIPNIATLYGLSGDTTADTIAVIYRNGAGTTQTENIYIPVKHAWNLAVTNVNETPMSVSLYPNPTTNSVFVNYSFAERANTVVSVVNLMGQTLITKDLGKQQTGLVNIPLQEVPAGIYVISVINGNQKSVQRLVKE